MAGLVDKLVRGTMDFVRLASFFDDRADPWSRKEMKIDPRAFGLASESNFSTYLEGPSQVLAETIDAICDWLRECQAVDDQTLFFRPDFWQHPVTFEQLKKGDCEDHALWAWRQLFRLRIPSVFVTGLWRDIPHTWVMMEHEGRDMLLETTCKSGAMLLPLETARHFYCPALGVDAACRTFVYQGYPRFQTARGCHLPPQ
jgi:hypothetical protein